MAGAQLCLSEGAGTALPSLSGSQPSRGRYFITGSSEDTVLFPPLIDPKATLRVTVPISYIRGTRKIK